MKRRATTSDVMRLQILMAQVEIAKIRMETARGLRKTMRAIWGFWKACRAFDSLAVQLHVDIPTVPRMRVL